MFEFVNGFVIPLFVNGFGLVTGFVNGFGL